MFGAKRFSNLQEGLDLSGLTPACFLVDKGEEAMIFMLFLGPRAKWSLRDLLVLVRHSFREDGVIYQASFLLNYQAKMLSWKAKNKAIFRRTNFKFLKRFWT